MITKEEKVETSVKAKVTITYEASDAAEASTKYARGITAEVIKKILTSSTIRDSPGYSEGQFVTIVATDKIDGKDPVAADVEPKAAAWTASTN